MVGVKSEGYKYHQHLLILSGLFYFSYVYVSLPEYLYVHCACKVHREARRGCWISWNQSYWQLWVIQYGCWDSNPTSLQDQPVFLTADTISSTFSKSFLTGLSQRLYVSKKAIKCFTSFRISTLTWWLCLYIAMYLDGFFKKVNHKNVFVCMILIWFEATQLGSRLGSHSLECTAPALRILTKVDFICRN